MNNDDASETLDWWGAYPLPPRSQSAHLRVNFISSADGAVTIDGRSGGLGGINDRTLMKVLRTLSDVVMVGAGTVRAEGYGGLGLSEPYLQRRAELGLSAVPRMAIVSGSLDLDPGMSVFTKAEARPLIITHGAAPPAKREALNKVADVLVCGNTQVDVALALNELADRGLPRVLCEGGPELFSSMLGADVVDEVCLTISPVFVAGGAPRIAHSASAHPRNFHVASLLSDSDGFVFLRYASDRAAR